MASRSERPAGARARRAWQRLQEFYGARLAENYGADVPQTWAEVFDRSSDGDIRRALVAVRAKYLHHPPTLPEFEEMLRPKRSLTETETVPQALTRAVVRLHWAGLSNWQRATRWNFIGEPYAGTSPTGEPRTEFTIVACVVPQDPADPKRYPSVRVNADPYAERAA